MIESLVDIILNPYNLLFNIDPNALTLSDINA